MGRLVVINDNHHITTQDLGRFGASKYGLTQGGAADLHAHCWGQKLLGNTMSSTSLEILLGRAKFRAEGDMTLVLTGADCNAEILTGSTDSRRVVNWHPFGLKDGQELHLSIPRTGCRTYISTSGGFDVATFMGSTSTVERDGVGGIKAGLPLATGDSLKSVDSDSSIPSDNMPRTAMPSYEGLRTLRIIPSFQYHQLNRCLLQRVLQQSYSVSPNSNRMGVRLQASLESEPVNTHSLISEGIVCGAVQLPPDGNPIVMLSDHQTLGGYPKLGVVAFRDLSVAAQLRPGDAVRLRLTNLPLERLKQRAFYRYFNL